MVRWQIFPEVPGLLLNALLPLQQENIAQHIGWGNLAQRFDIILVSLYVMAGVGGLGHWLLRWIYPQGVLDTLERIVFSFAIGISAWSLITLFLGLMGFLSRPLFMGILLLFIFVESGRASRKRTLPNKKSDQTKKEILHNETSLSSWLSRLCLGVMGFFFLWMFLGALLPSTDFDVREYHLQGPKEFYQNGAVSFLPHNVYTSFPFLTEMLTLSAMVVRGDWYLGALAGKGLLVCFAPLTALALFCAGRRWFSETAGWLAALIFMTTPWIHRISIIAYAEGGVTFFLFATLFAVMIALEKTNFANIKQRKRQLLFVGMMAGSAMACKYPAALTVVIPLFSVVSVAGLLSEKEMKKRFSVTLQSLCFMGAGLLIAMGPWLIKNTIETKNPVYPLVYSLVGGDHWDAAMDAKWKKAHSPTHHRLTGNRGMIFWMEDLTARSDWLSPLLYAFAPLAFLVMKRKRMIGLLWLYVFFLFFAWWGLTHRLDRFWVPMIPVAALLAGAGMTWSKHIVWKSVAGTCCAVVIFFNAGFNVSALCGNNSYLYDFSYLKDRETSPSFKLLNSSLQGKEARVLCVGEAEVFNTEFPVVYNTVFDDSIFQQWTARDGKDQANKDIPMKEATAIRERFRKEKITHVFINWEEILRYRTSYGYTNYVTPARFTLLQQMGILNFPLSSHRLYESFSKGEKEEIHRWAPELLTVIDVNENVDGKITVRRKQAVITSQIYQVTQ